MEFMHRQKGRTQHFHFDVASPERITGGIDAMTLMEIEPHFFRLERPLTAGINRLDLHIGT